MLPGIDDSAMKALLAPVRSRIDVDHKDREASDCEEQFARVAWSSLAEPGDGTAGEYVAALGPNRALASLIEGWSLRAALAAVREAGGALDQAELRQAINRWKPRLSLTSVVQNLHLAARVDAQLIFPGDAAWIAGLDDLGPHARSVLWMRGDHQALSSECANDGTAPATALPAVAVVGARASTEYGEYLTGEIVAGLCARNIPIVSGGAYGIDARAHRVALAVGGTTAAILAGGIDRLYPRGNDELFSRIVATGVIISEVPCGTPPTAWRFLQRNRLISAASSATVVIEAGIRSGSINTAHHSLALGRAVGAVPGPVTSPSSAGCHRLLKDQQASCVTTADDVLELLEFFPSGDANNADIAGNSSQNSVDRLSDEQRRVLEAMSTRAPRESVDITRRSGLALDQTEQLLAVLEIEGLVSEDLLGWTKAAVRR